MNKQHPIHGKDDTACKWLCLSAGQRTMADEREISHALVSLGLQPVKQLPYVDMLARVK